jgi:lysyl-tRNA synthetase class II
LFRPTISRHERSGVTSYVDLIMDEAARKRFASRSKAVSGIREFTWWPTTL